MSLLIEESTIEAPVSSFPQEEPVTNSEQFIPQGTEEVGPVFDPILEKFDTAAEVEKALFEQGYTFSRFGKVRHTVAQYTSVQKGKKAFNGKKLNLDPLLKPPKGHILKGGLIDVMLLQQGTWKERLVRGTALTTRSFQQDFGGNFEDRKEIVKKMATRSGMIASIAIPLSLSSANIFASGNPLTRAVAAGIGAAVGATTELSQKGIFKFYEVDKATREMIAIMENPDSLDPSNQLRYFHSLLTNPALKELHDTQVRRIAEALKRNKDAQEVALIVNPVRERYAETTDVITTEDGQKTTKKRLVDRIELLQQGHATFRSLLERVSNPQLRAEIFTLYMGIEENTQTSDIAKNIEQRIQQRYRTIVAALSASSVVTSVAMADIFMGVQGFVGHMIEENSTLFKGFTTQIPSPSLPHSNTVLIAADFQDTRGHNIDYTDIIQPQSAIHHAPMDAPTMHTAPQVQDTDIFSHDQHIQEALANARERNMASLTAYKAEVAQAATQKAAKEVTVQTQQHLVDQLNASHIAVSAQLLETLKENHVTNLSPEAMQVFKVIDTKHPEFLKDPELLKLLFNNNGQIDVSHALNALQTFENLHNEAWNSIQWVSEGKQYLMLPDSQGNLVPTQITIYPGEGISQVFARYNIDINSPQAWEIIKASQAHYHTFTQTTSPIGNIGENLAKQNAFFAKVLKGEVNIDSLNQLNQYDRMYASYHVMLQEAAKNAPHPIDTHTHIAAPVVPSAPAIQHVQTPDESSYGLAQAHPQSIGAVSHPTTPDESSYLTAHAQTTASAQQFNRTLPFKPYTPEEQLYLLEHAHQTVVSTPSTTNSIEAVALSTTHTQADVQHTAEALIQPELDTSKPLQIIIPNLSDYTSFQYFKNLVDAMPVAQYSTQFSNFDPNVVFAGLHSSIKDFEANVRFITDSNDSYQMTNNVFGTHPYIEMREVVNPDGLMYFAPIHGGPYEHAYNTRWNISNFAHGIPVDAPGPWDYSTFIENPYNIPLHTHIMLRQGNQVFLYELDEKIDTSQLNNPTMDSDIAQAHMSSNLVESQWQEVIAHRQAVDSSYKGALVTYTCKYGANDPQKYVLIFKRI